MSMGEHIVMVILTEEMRRRGYIDLAGLAERLMLYLDPADRRKVMVSAVAAGAEPGCNIEDAFLFLIPIDARIEAHVYGLRLQMPPRLSQ